MKNELERQTELQKLYLRNMQLIKWRLRAISDIREGKTKTTYKITNTEFCVLQIRKILELIALSALVSDVDLYREKLGNIDRMWNAKLILQDVERIHPNFYPEPIYIDPKNRFQWQPRKAPYLTKDEFIVAYNRCGKFLHEGSPFMSNKEIDSAYEQIWDDVYRWGQLIINLLYTHAVRLYNEKDLFYIAMGDEKERPHGNIFTKVEGEDSSDGPHEI